MGNSTFNLRRLPKKQDVGREKRTSSSDLHGPQVQNLWWNPKTRRNVMVSMFERTFHLLRMSSKSTKKIGAWTAFHQPFVQLQSHCDFKTQRNHRQTDHDSTFPMLVQQKWLRCRAFCRRHTKSRKELQISRLAMFHLQGNNRIPHAY